MKKRITLPKSVAIKRLDDIWSLVEDNLRITIDVEAVLEEANAAVKSLPNKFFFGADSYNIAKQCMAFNLAIAAARLFDPGRKRGKKNRSDVASIPLLVHFLKQKRCRDILLDRARNWTPGLRGSDDKNAEDCNEAINNALTVYSSLIRSPQGRRALAALRTFRNVRLAHTLLIEDVLRNIPTYDDLFSLVAVAREFSIHAKLAITGTNTDFVEVGRLRRVDAEIFWRTALLAVAADNVSEVVR
jgi:hypothetical protein